MPKRPKIYALLTTIKELVPSSGDKINEINLYKAMSTFADVYYNNQLFKPNEPGFGIKPMPIDVPYNKAVDYDYCYIRNNKKVFQAFCEVRDRVIETGGDRAPKVLWVASPYIEGVFKRADAVVTYTESWKRQLKTLGSHSIGGLYNPQDTYIPDNVLVFPQAIDIDEFSNKKNHEKTLEYRKTFDADFVISHFGRIAAGNYPHSLLHILPKVCAKYPEKKIKFIYSGLPSQIKMEIDSPSCQVVSGIPYEDMSYAISACDLVSSDYRSSTANWGGSRHVLESMGCGTPVLTGDFTVRREQLGENYRLFWKWEQNKGRISDRAEEEMFNHICFLIDNPNKAAVIGQKMIARSKSYSYEQVGIKIKSELDSI